MKKGNTKAIAVGLSYVGAVVGAGFISGQEIVQFFLRFSLFGVIGWVIVSLAIIIGGGAILSTVSKSKPDSFEDFLKSHFNSKVAKFGVLIFNGYLIGGLIIMLSGSGSLVSDIFGIPLFFGVLLIVIQIFITIIGEGRRLLTVNSFLVPFLMISVLLVSFKLIFGGDYTVDLSKTFLVNNPSIFLVNWWVSPILYIGYNAVGAIVALVNISRESEPDKAKKGGIIGGLVITLLGSLIFFTLWISSSYWEGQEVPMMSIVGQKVTWLAPLFVPSMVIAMFTTATAYALGLANFFHQKIGGNFKLVCVGLLVVVTPISLLGFSKLLGTIYPFFGIMATILLLWLLLSKVFSKVFISR